MKHFVNKELLEKKLQQEENKPYWLRTLYDDRSQYYNLIKWEDNSSCECKKVVSDILGEIKFVVDIKSARKMAHFQS